MIDEKQLERYFGSNDLTDLYTFNADGLLHLSDSTKQEYLLHSGDQLLSGLVVRRKEWVSAVRQHNSMLQNHPEESLGVAEQQAIWKVFQRPRLKNRNEKTIQYSYSKNLRDFNFFLRI